MKDTPWYMTEPLEIENPLETDSFLKPYLKLRFPKSVYDEILVDLTRFSNRIVDEIEKLGLQAEAEVPFIDTANNSVVVSKAWEELDKISAQEGLVALGYNRNYGSLSRIYQFTKIYLFHPSSAYYTCPLAMTDGAAKLIELHGGAFLKDTVMSHLTSTEPEEFWTSGQWMTERSGGSDLSGTETWVEKKGDKWFAYGPKHFTSAITAPVAMLLARTQKDNNRLTVFYCQTRKNNTESWNNLKIVKLKEKLGTRALPTAEIELEGIPCEMIGEEGAGVKVISSLFNISRIHNAFAATSTSARVLQLWNQFSKKRKSFGKTIAEHKLHRQVYSHLLNIHKKQFLFTFFVADLLGQTECEPNENTQKLLRLLTPVAKLSTARQAIQIVSEALEGFGGAGYMEDLGIAKYFRDVQVLSIWEGTTNVLSLDVLRAIHKESVWPAYISWVEDILNKHEKLGEGTELLKKLQNIKHEEASARELTTHIAELTSYCLSLMYSI